MRVIAGKCRGRKLESPKNQDRTRPTEAMVKEAVMNILQPIRQGAVVLDLFAGSGQMGIEFLSRGADYCFFSEIAKPLIPILQANLQKTRLEENARILHGDFRRGIERVDRQLDYVYMDPPYQKGYEFEAIEALRHSKKLKKDGIVVVESAAGDPWSCRLEGFRCIFQRIYKNTQIQIFKEERS
ncbi:MAG: 16S rRNA (guanine(966)-N(2))-methyltransferase RsmD [Peptoniphilaceae bacterium]|nr:16S rRNA (guanine(966)-N(2))-methyltransferase RsmD [Peptoniphilaceae bacterium]MDY5766109.1 16S rRNA (guanine(966)-N(2))-methyltransferase RsmD [Peptoniphilaceae bacterium]